MGDNQSLLAKVHEQTMATRLNRLNQRGDSPGFDDDYNRDSERLRILISLTVWAIWKARNKNTTSNQNVSLNESKELLKDLISSLIRNSWIETCFTNDKKRLTRQRELRALWGDKHFANFDARPYPTVDFS